MALVIDPESEVRYRVRLVEGYLREAEENFKREDFRATVAASQLAAENAAKAIIAIFRIPSWSHDPSHELREVISQLPQSLRPLAEELAGIAQLLAPEHGRVTYGEPTRGLTPWEIYGREDAEKALQLAKKAVELMRLILRELKML
jgi:HEPN domain-containing protein